ncbi:hypothetical protein Aperf_G00000000340 [Anoplocephala perfoliata]
MCSVMLLEKPILLVLFCSVFLSDYAYSALSSLENVPELDKQLKEDLALIAKLYTPDNISREEYHYALSKLESVYHTIRTLNKTQSELLLKYMAEEAWFMIQFGHLFTTTTTTTSPTTMRTTSPANTSSTTTSISTTSNKFASPSTTRSTNTTPATIRPASTVPTTTSPTTVRHTYTRPVSTGPITTGTSTTGNTTTLLNTTRNMTTPLPSTSPTTTRLTTTRPTTTTRHTTTVLVEIPSPPPSNVELFPIYDCPRICYSGYGYYWYINSSGSYEFFGGYDENPCPGALTCRLRAEADRLRWQREFIQSFPNIPPTLVETLRGKKSALIQFVIVNHKNLRDLLNSAQPETIAYMLYSAPTSLAEYMVLLDRKSIDSILKHVRNLCEFVESLPPKIKAILYFKSVLLSMCIPATPHPRPKLEIERPQYSGMTIFSKAELDELEFIVPGISELISKLCPKSVVDFRMANPDFMLQIRNHIMSNPRTLDDVRKLWGELKGMSSENIAYILEQKVATMPWLRMVIPLLKKSV